MMVDAAFLVDVVRGDPAARALLEESERGAEAVRVPAPAVAKLWEALSRSRHPPRDVDRVRAILLAQPSLAFTPKHAIRAGRILADEAGQLAPLDPLDAMTVAMAVEEDEALVSRNARDLARVEGLRLRTY